MSEAVIYQIKNKVNNKIYIGSTVDRRSRWSTHKYLLERGKHHNPHLQNAYNKYGSENFKFTIVERINRTEDLVQREQYYIDTLKPEYNIILKADRSEMSEEHKQKISESMKDKRAGKDSPLYGRKLPEETKKKISDALAGREVSEEHRKKLSKAMKGKKSPLRGRNLPKDVKRKISESQQGSKNPMYNITGEDHPQSKVTNQEIKSIYRTYHTTNKTQAEIAKDYPISRRRVGTIANKDYKYIANL